ncbi:MAG: hypothetical protein V4556_10870 [Bacteroidota bacterium]
MKFLNNINYRLLASLLIALILLVASCTNKFVPEKVPTSATKKTTVKLKKASVPNVITINDHLASKNPEGRLFYDFQYHRYWRNNTDGRYYLFTRSMYNNSAFKPQ